MADYVLTGQYWPTTYWPVTNEYWPLAPTDAETVVLIGTTGGFGRLQLSVRQDTADSHMIADWSHASEIECVDGEHGHEYLSAVVPLSFQEAVYVYDQVPGKHLILSNGAEHIFEGRVEDRGIQGGGLRVQALGYWRAFSDIPYTALWSDTGLGLWRPLNSSDSAAFTAELFEIDNSNRLYISPQKEVAIGAATIGAMGYQSPDDGQRQIIGTAFEYEFSGTADWEARFSRRGNDWSLTADVWTLTGTGQVQRGAVYQTFTGVDNISFSLHYVGAVPQPLTWETGDIYLKITAVRVFTSTTNQVNTTASGAIALSVNTTASGAIAAGSTVVTPASMTNIAVNDSLIIRDDKLDVDTIYANNIAAGASVVTPASMTNIAVGDVLYVDGEPVIVTATTATTFTATFVNGHNGDAVKPVIIKARPAQEIVTVTATTATTFTAVFTKPYSQGAIIREATSVTVTPGSMTGIYAGQILYIGGTTGEAITTTAVTASTFTAVFTRPHSSSVTIKSPLVYAGEIVEALLSFVVGINSNQLDSGIMHIESPGRDLRDTLYEDVYPADILTAFVRLGDSSSPPGLYEVGVRENRLLYFRPIASQGRRWYVDAVELEVNSTLETLVNSAYGLYTDVNGRTLRTAVSADSDSLNRYGITRRGFISSESSSHAQAQTMRDALLNDRKQPPPPSRLTLNGLFDENGAQFPLWHCRQGDTITIRNLPPGLTTDIDRIRTFRVKRRTYRPIENVMIPVPEEDIPSLEFLIANK